MPIMEPPFEQLKEKLKEIFQLDRRDLDFGIYRILNIKSAEIRGFLDEKLLPQVHKVLEEYQGKEVGILQAKLQQAIAGAKVAGINPDDAPKVQERNKQIAVLRGDLDERAKVVFSDLYNFFRRYYKDGDFLSLRRYKKDVYALPYEGEEVKLHWANADQYYIKSSEKFGRYVFRAGDKRITLEVAAADTERDNNKANGKTLRYLPLPNEEDELFTIQGTQMNIRFACTATDDRRQQETINKESAEELLAAMPAEWRVMLKQLVPTKKNGDRCLLHKHISTFTARNTFDYFIHKDLRGFLRRELDFYIKNEVMLLDDIEEADAPTADVWLGRAFALRKVGHKIIDFLAQMENFQKRLWLKKKFVLQTNYCAALGHLPLAVMPKLLARILSNEAQWVEWESLGIVRNSDFAGDNDQKKREEFLRQNPSLPVDTRHFDKNFQYELLAGYDNLNEVCDGVLIHGENFQALNLLREKYCGKSKCIYIDPPYNTNASAILYKNDYKNSSWLSLMGDRLLLSREFLANNGILCCAIDDEEFWRLRAVMDIIFNKEIGVATVRSNPVGRKTRGKFSPTHEYALFYGEAEAVPGILLKTDRELMRYPFSDEIGKYAWLTLIRQGSNDRREDSPKLFYPIYVGADDALRVPEMVWDERMREYKILEKATKDETVVLPIVETENGVIEKNWQRGQERVKQEPNEYRIRRYENGQINIQFKTRMDENAVPKTWWDNNKYASSNGTIMLKNILPNNLFDFPKSVELVADCIRASGADVANAEIIDYFAGSGTTAHAVINLNREDCGRRKFIMAEMGEYFSTVLLPRIKKVMYAPEWKDGKPKQKATDEEFEYGPRLIKYQCIESYEDALDNLQDKPPDAPRAKESFANQAMREDYMLHYFLDVETKDSASLLNVESMAAYDKYHLHITREGKTEKMPIDLVETFNYLLGLRVAKIRREREVLMIEGQNPQGDNVLVIWRDANTMSAKQLNEWFRTVEINLHNNEYDIIYINGDNLVESLRLSEEVWKVRSTEKEFRRLMFEDTD